MSKRNNPDTSIEAYKSIDLEKVALMYKKIHQALIELGPCTYEQIAEYWQEKPERVWKRMSEAAKLGLCHRTGERRVMASGRQGFVWGHGGTPESVKKREKVMKGPTVQQFAKAINQVSPSIKIFERLF